VIKVLKWASKELIFFEHLESSENKNIKLQECAVVAINSVRARSLGDTMRNYLKLGGVGIYNSENSPNISPISTKYQPY
jgi:hypothetical protein